MKFSIALLKKYGANPNEEKLFNYIKKLSGSLSLAEELFLKRRVLRGELNSENEIDIAYGNILYYKSFKHLAETLSQSSLANYETYEEFESDVNLVKSVKELLEIVHSERGSVGYNTRTWLERLILEGDVRDETQIRKTMQYIRIWEVISENPDYYGPVDYGALSSWRGLVDILKKNYLLILKRFMDINIPEELKPDKEKVTQDIFSLPDEELFDYIEKNGLISVILLRKIPEHLLKRDKFIEKFYTFILEKSMIAGFESHLKERPDILSKIIIEQIGKVGYSISGMFTSTKYLVNNFNFLRGISAEAKNYLTSLMIKHPNFYSYPVRNISNIEELFGTEYAIKMVLEVAKENPHIILPMLILYYSKPLNVKAMKLIRKASINWVYSPEVVNRFKQWVTNIGPDSFMDYFHGQYKYDPESLVPGLLNLFKFIKLDLPKEQLFSFFDSLFEKNRPMTNYQTSSADETAFAQFKNYIARKEKNDEMEELFFLRDDYTPNEAGKAFIQAWKTSSRMPASQAVQIVANEVLGGDKKVKMYFNEETPKHINEEFYQKHTNPKAKEVIKTFLQDIYKRTQDNLRENIAKDPHAEMIGENHIRLYRGVEKEVSIPSIFEAWSSSVDVGHQFDGYEVIKMDVPLDAVYVTWNSPDWEAPKGGAGLREFEYILIGSKLDYKNRFIGDDSGSRFDPNQRPKITKADAEYMDSLSDALDQMGKEYVANYWLDATMDTDEFHVSLGWPIGVLFNEIPIRDKKWGIWVSIYKNEDASLDLLIESKLAPNIIYRNIYTSVVILDKVMHYIYDARQYM